MRCPWHGSVFRLSDKWNVKTWSTGPVSPRPENPPETAYSSDSSVDHAGPPGPTVGVKVCRGADSPGTITDVPVSDIPPTVAPDACAAGRQHLRVTGEQERATRTQERLRTIRAAGTSPLTTSYQDAAP